MDEPFDWTSVDWEDLYPRLLLFARKKIGRLHWRVRKAPEDFTNDAIRKTIEGIRRWEPDRTPLFNHLCGVVSSDVHCAVVSIDNMAVESINFDADVVIRFPDHRLMSIEEQMLRDNLVDEFLLFLGEYYPRLVKLAKIILFEPECGDPRLALELGVAVRDIDGMRRVLKKATRAFALRIGSDGKNISGK